VAEREVFDDVLEEHRRRRAVREWEAPAQIPMKVRVHPEDVDVHPAWELVRPAAEMEPDRPVPGEAPSLDARHGPEQLRPPDLPRLAEAVRRDVPERTDEPPSR